jgi:hypothetical protein
MSNQVVIEPKFFQFSLPPARLESVLDWLDIRSLLSAMQVCQGWYRAGEADRIWSKFIDHDLATQRHGTFIQVGMYIAPWNMSGGEAREAPSNWVTGNFRVAVRNFTLASRVPPEIWHQRLVWLNSERNPLVPLLAATRPLNSLLCEDLALHSHTTRWRAYLWALSSAVAEGNTSTVWKWAFLSKAQVVPIDFKALGIDVSERPKATAVPATTEDSCSIL